ncbi:MAG: hypothetical protein WBA12_02110 [Catalinimonas sp.]
MLVAALTACEKGEPLLNQPPETSLVVDTINLRGQDRLNSQVRLQWSGTDADGYVTGYEVSLDAQSWSFVTTQDSTFRFDVPEGSDSVDVTFYVRAVDNEGATDPTPATLGVPIKNTAPTATFTARTVNVANEEVDIVLLDTLQTVFSVNWQVDDLDGPNTLDSTFVRANDGPWYALPSGVEFITLVPQQPRAVGAVAATVHVGFDAQANATPLTGLVLGDTNRLYLRTRDISGALSDPDTTDAFYLLPQTSDLLVMDLKASNEEDDDELYADLIGSTYGGFDRIDVATVEGDYYAQWNPTFRLLSDLYDIIYWYDVGIYSIGQTPTIELAAPILQGFLDRGGKLVFVGQLPRYPTTLTPESLLFQLFPMDSLSSSTEGRAEIKRDSVVVPLVPELDTLVPVGFLRQVNPFYLGSGAEEVYRAQISAARGWTGPATFGARRRYTNGRVQLYFFAIELTQLNGRPEALENLFRQILVEDFDW